MSLHLENELSAMAQQLFTEELLDKLLNNNREKSLARDGGAYDWDDHGALEAFHLGYRAALRSLRVSQGALSTADLLPKILLTEHDLGIVQTSQEQEWRKTIQARQRARSSPPRSPKA